MTTNALKKAIRYTPFPCFNRLFSSGKHARAMQGMSHTNHVQNIKRDDNIYDISNTIAKKIDRVSLSDPKSHIFRVHHQLRVVNEKAYEPVLLSIGPYHHGKSNLQRMEKYKLQYLNRLIQQREAKGFTRSQQLNTYLRTLKEGEDEVRCYYDEAIILKPNKLLEMMLLDGCFIIELFHEFSRVEKERDPFLKPDWVHNALARDLTLLENQLPFLVLKSLHNVISDEPDLLHLIFTALDYLPTYSNLPLCQNQHEKSIARQSISDLAKRSLLPAGSTSLKGRHLDPENLNDIKHLLDLVRKFMLVEETLEMESQTQQGAHQAKGAVSRNCMERRTKKFAYSAMELRDSGVTFKGVEKGKFYDIRFENGILEIPVIRITDNMEALFRNLIAYEEHAPGNGVNYISDYMAFVDGLINSTKDVELLRRKGIIENLMGDDEAVSMMFNRMNKNTAVTPDFYYEDIINSLTVHCEKRWNIWLAKLKRNYLNSPWAVLSIVIGFLLVVMDITQTAYAVLNYHKHVK
ncbi:UPF0481 protein At3g47200-like [Punica granatum]|uniref:Uncharacterized protein n=2 Tax=Punica granatum TaxID=22663 RepID=A0A218XQM3_PUNGR|nr:UPF0481 protein At3g47200-like [Punica granatum]OWM87263.1 hypothetical protein CDL15_Pgr019310 [Punica granatum]PKI41914.1 hypothetical protein CRG98_037664 [Punica granatum]